MTNNLKTEMIKQKMLQTLHPVSHPDNLTIYQYIIDLDSSVMWEKEMVTKDRVSFYSGNFKSVNDTQPISYFKFKGKQLMEFSDIYYKYLVVANKLFTPEELSFQAFLFFNNLQGQPYDENMIDGVDYNLHWVWIRKPGFRLPDEIVMRINTWIITNPDYKFYLWTNIQDKTEKEDFLSNLSEKYRCIMDRVELKYREETLKMAHDFIQKYNLPESIYQMFSRDNSYELVFKTDYIRMIAVYTYGGMYSDFNDVICFYKMTPYINLIQDKILATCDNREYNNCNNYFFYARKECPVLLGIIQDYFQKYPEIEKELHTVDEKTVKLEKFLEFLKSKQQLTVEDLIRYYGLENHRMPNRILQDEMKLEMNLMYDIQALRPIHDTLQRVLRGGSRHRRFGPQSHGITVPEFECNISDEYCKKIVMNAYARGFYTRTNFGFGEENYKRERMYILPFSYNKFINSLSVISHLYDGTSFGCEKNYAADPIKNLLSNMGNKQIAVPN